MVFKEGVVFKEGGGVVFKEGVWYLKRVCI